MLLLCCDDFFKENAFCFSPEQVLFQHEMSGVVRIYILRIIRISIHT